MLQSWCWAPHLGNALPHCLFVLDFPQLLFLDGSNAPPHGGSPANLPMHAGVGGGAPSGAGVRGSLRLRSPPASWACTCRGDTSSSVSALHPCSAGAGQLACRKMLGECGHPACRSGVHDSWIECCQFTVQFSFPSPPGSFIQSRSTWHSRCSTLLPPLALEFSGTVRAKTGPCRSCVSRSGVFREAVAMYVSWNRMGRGLPRAATKTPTAMSQQRPTANGDQPEYKPATNGASGSQSLQRWVGLLLHPSSAPTSRPWRTYQLHMHAWPSAGEEGRRLYCQAPTTRRCGISTETGCWGC